MFTVFGFVTKRDDLTSAEFIDYYENHHVPLILSLAPAPAVYKRHYVCHGDELNVADSSFDFDAVTEQQFASRSEFTAWITAVTSGSAGERVAADEAQFLDRARTRACVAATHESSCAASTSRDGVFSVGATGTSVEPPMNTTSDTIRPPR